MGWVKILKVVGTHTHKESKWKRKSFYSPGSSFQIYSLDFHLKGQNVLCIDIILKLLMTSKQSVVVNKVNVLMPNVCLHVGVEQKMESLQCLFFISFLVIADD